MNELTLAERNFLEIGGAIWCLRSVESERWEIYKQMWDSEKVFSVTSATREQAIRWIFVLVDLTLPDEKIAIHHDIACSIIETEFRFKSLI